MDLTNIESKLNDITKNINSKELQVYLFGSYISKRFYEDIDILIIYEDFNLMKSIKKRINDELVEFFPHITCLTFEEEIELRFIQQANAKTILI